MKYLLIIILTTTIWGCNSESESTSSETKTNLSFDSVDLTGTWLSATETRKIKDDTGEYLLSDFNESTYIMEDTENGVKYSRCSDYWNFYSGYAVKTSEHFYMSLNDGSEAGFTLQDDDTLKKVSYSTDEYSPGYNFESITTLTKINDGVSINNGSLVLTGPVSVAEYDQSCLWKNYSSIGERQSLSFSVPYGDDNLTFSLYSYVDISVGSYSYTDYFDAKAVRLDVYSYTDDFRDIADSSYLEPENVTIEVTESTDEKLVGFFSFTGNDEQLYSGEFDIQLGYIESQSNEVE